MSELIDHLIALWKDVHHEYQVLGEKLGILGNCVMEIMQRYGEAKPVDEKKVTVFEEKGLKELPWQENKKGSGWYVRKDQAPELWDAIMEQRDRVYRLGEYFYRVFNPDMPFIHKFPVKKKEAK